MQKKAFLFFYICFITFCLHDLYAVPPGCVPKKQRAAFTLDGKIPIVIYYWDNTVGSEGTFYSRNTVDELILKGERYVVSKHKC